MSLPKHPSPEQTSDYIARTPREEDETKEAHLRRMLRQIVLANVQTDVAMALNTSGGKIKACCQGERAQLAAISRIAEACNCEVIIRALP